LRSELILKTNKKKNINIYLGGINAINKINAQLIDLMNLNNYTVIYR
jgi:hypothetical protein